MSTALSDFAARVEGDPGHRQQAVKDAHRLARSFMALACVLEDLSQFATAADGVAHYEGKRDRTEAEANVLFLWGEVGEDGESSSLRDSLDPQEFLAISLWAWIRQVDECRLSNPLFRMCDGAIAGAYNHLTLTFSSR